MLLSKLPYSKLKAAAFEVFGERCLTPECPHRADLTVSILRDCPFIPEIITRDHINILCYDCRKSSRPTSPVRIEPQTTRRQHAPRTDNTRRDNRILNRIAHQFYRHNCSKAGCGAKKGLVAVVLVGTFHPKINPKNTALLCRAHRNQFYQVARKIKEFQEKRARGVKNVECYTPKFQHIHEWLHHKTIEPSKPNLQIIPIQTTDFGPVRSGASLPTLDRGTTLGNKHPAHPHSPEPFNKGSFRVRAEHDATEFLRSTP